MIISLIRLKTINEFTRAVNPTSTPPSFQPLTPSITTQVPMAT
jgi:hypothetical protein